MRKRTMLVLAALCALAMAGVLALTLCGAEGLTVPAPGEALLRASDGLDAIELEVAPDIAHGTAEVKQTLRLQNRTGQTLRALALRTWANAFRTVESSPAASDERFQACYPGGFSAGGLTLRAARVAEDAQAAYAYDDTAQTLLRFTLSQDWPAGEWRSVTLSYTLTVPECAYLFGRSGGVWTLAHAFAEPAVFEGGAYKAQPWPPVGEPFDSECANYRVTLTLPQGWRAAASAGGEEAPQEDGTTLVRFTALAARDFSLCLSADYTLSEAMEGGVLVRAYALQRSGDALRYARAALADYAARYGAYPYPCYTVAQAGFESAATALSLLDAGALGGDAEALDWTLARETARQWWKIAVGADDYNQPWMDWGVSQYAALQYWSASRDRSAAQARWITPWLRASLGGTLTLGCPIDWYGDTDDFYAMVCARGEALMEALDLALDGGLDGFLASYYHTYAFGRASRQGFAALLNQFSGGDWTPLLSDYLDTLQ